MKVLWTALWVTLLEGMTRKYPPMAAILASLPVTSILVMGWMAFSKEDPQGIIRFSEGVAWLVAPSLVFFVVVSLTLRQGMDAPWAIGVGIVSTVVAYGAMLYGLNQLGITI